jgi:hypothetical protein
VTFLLKAVIAEPEDTAIAKQWFSKHFSLMMDGQMQQ